MVAAGGHPTPTSGPRPPGRPRLYEPGEERVRILSAALDVLRRNGGQEITVADILREAGLSTRAFYRHFETKEDVIRALYQRDAESFGTHLRRKVDAASGSRQALEVWIFETLGLVYDRRRAERVAALGSPMVARVVAGSSERQLGEDLLAAPLRVALTDGLAVGVFPLAHPELDVPTVKAITWEAIAWARNGVVKLTRREATDHVLRFTLNAFGASD
jgi:AcrR family transcriptional regulator